MSEPYTWDRFDQDLKYASECLDRGESTVPAALLVDAITWLGRQCVRHGTPDIVEDQEKEIGRLRALTESNQIARRIEELEMRERYHLERIAELESHVAKFGAPDASQKP